MDCEKCRYSINVKAVGLGIVLVCSLCSKNKKEKKDKMQNAEKLVFGG